MSFYIFSHKPAVVEWLSKTSTCFKWKCVQKLWKRMRTVWMTGFKSFREFCNFLKHLERLATFWIGSGKYLPHCK